jgi:hypothetical protein
VVCRGGLHCRVGEVAFGLAMRVRAQVWRLAVSLPAPCQGIYTILSPTPKDVALWLLVELLSKESEGISLRLWSSQILLEDGESITLRVP